MPDIDQMNSPPRADSRLAVFMIETAALTKSTVVADQDPRGYGESGADWRPFPEQELPLAEYAMQVVRRLDFEAEVAVIRTVADPRTRRPGIILVDPWFIAGENGRTALKSAVDNLPRWVISLIILNQPDDARARKLADEVRDILKTARALPTNSARRAAKGVSSLQEFVSIMQVLVAEAERQYLRYRGQYWSGQKASSPSNTRPISPPDQWGEAPDA